MLMARKVDKGEGSAENVSVGASDNNTADDNGEESEYAGPDVTGEPDEDAESDAIQRVIARTAHGRKPAKKRIVPLTIEDDAKNTTKFHAAMQREVRKAAKDAESAKMKFSEKRAYTVVPEIVSSKPHTSKATLKANKNKKWVTVSSSFVELSEGRRGQGIIEAASCVCNGKCEKPMEDAVNCPCDCAAAPTMYNRWYNQRRKSCSQQRELPQWLVQAMRRTCLNWFQKALLEAGWLQIYVRRLTMMS